MSDFTEQEILEGGMLRLYFEAESVMGDKSPFWGMMERAATYALRHARRSCKTCDGTGIDPRPIERWNEAKAAYGEKMSLLFDDFLPYERVAQLPDVSCARCGGSGETAGRTQPGEVSARPTHETPDSPQNFGISDTAERAARATRIMAAVGRVDEVHRCALIAYYGERGEFCAGARGIGRRLVSIIPLTEQGEKFLGKRMELSWKRVSHDLGALAYGSQDDGARLAALEEAAQRLLHAAHRTWSECCAG